MKQDYDENDPEDFRVEDRRHWNRDTVEAEPAEEQAPRAPSAVDDLRRRAEDAERRLLEYIAAFKEREREQEAFRVRIAADVDRRVELRFGDVVAQLLEAVDELDLALAHGEGVAAAQPLVAGVKLVRDRFLATLERNGVERIAPLGQLFDPHNAEAVRVDGVAEPERDGTVTEMLQPGYRLGERVIRPARVAVGRYGDPADR